MLIPWRVIIPNWGNAIYFDSRFLDFQGLAKNLIRVLSRRAMLSEFDRYLRQETEEIWQAVE